MTTHVASLVESKPPSAERRKRRMREQWSGVAYVLPSFLILCLIALIPIGYSFYLSFTEYDVLTTPRPVGLANYRRLISDPNFWLALKNTAIFTAIAVPLQVGISMVLAEILAKADRPALSGFVRSVLFVPVVASLILVGTVWQYMLAADSGFFNMVLKAFGLSPINFLGRPWLALISVTLVSVWKNVGYFLVLFYAGVMDIPREQYEAADLDGANAVQKFVFVTVPGLKPVTVLCVLLSTIWSFQVFDLVYAMTGGGPGGATSTIVMAIYESGFKLFQMGYASAIAMVLLVVIVIVSILQRLVMKEE